MRNEASKLELFFTPIFTLTVIHDAARVYHNTKIISTFFNLTYGTMGLNVLGY